MPNPFEDHKITIEGEECYCAGLPGYPRNFSRDTLISGILALDAELLHNQLLMSRDHQGVKDDPMSGEEAGKIHHEYPGVGVHPPYVSTYNACDTTALYLIGIEFLAKLDEERGQEFIDSNKDSIEAAVSYLEEHTEDDTFWEYPPAGAKHFSLHTTYWKDSIVPNPDWQEEPSYPVSFGLVQFQVARGLMSAATILKNERYEQSANRMFEAGIENFITPEAYCIEESKRRLEQISSDELHALAYIPERFADKLPLEAIKKRAEELITDAGIASTPKEIASKLTDQYHGYVVWVFEQALIHYACQKFGLEEFIPITMLSAANIANGYELFSVEPQIQPIGNTHQLWSIAADIYFSEAPSLRNNAWL